MLLAAFFVWVCAMTGVSCECTPNAAIIQTAYEQQAPSPGVRYDKGLRIVDASCNSGENGRFLCQVSCVSEDDPGKACYFDTASSVHSDKGWTLTSGLCKR